jgi:hypothetical protein
LFLVLTNLAYLVEGLLVLFYVMGNIVDIHRTRLKSPPAANRSKDRPDQPLPETYTAIRSSYEPDQSTSFAPSTPHSLS